MISDYQKTSKSRIKLFFFWKRMVKYCFLICLHACAKLLNNNYKLDHTT